MKKIFGVLSLAIVISFYFSTQSCTPDPVIVIETETDTLYITEIDTVFIELTDTLNLTEFVLDTATSFILVRHADTEDGDDPVLSAAGIARAAELADMLGAVPLSSVMSTDYNRTRETAQVVADNQGLVVDLYNPAAIGYTVNQILENHWGETVLVVGHSNTTPDMLNFILSANVYDDFDEEEYDNLFIVSVFEEGRAKVIHLKYGE